MRLQDVDNAPPDPGHCLCSLMCWSAMVALRMIRIRCIARCRETEQTNPAALAAGHSHYFSIDIRTACHR